MDRQDSTVLPPGTRIDQYVVVGLLGRGGFGITYLVHDESLQSDFALKEFFPESLVMREGTSVRIRSNPTSETEYRWGLKKFYDEARLLVQFSHPNIVSVRRVFEANNSAYMLLEYVDGVTLEAWLKSLDTPPTQEELDTIVSRLLSALALVHRNRTWHLDLSPENIMIRRADGAPVLLDFGASRLEIKQRSHVVSALVFKSGYSAPEQYSSRAERYGPWTDIYAIGATLHRAISGKLPLEATERQLKDELAPARRVATAQYREGFLDAIDWAMQLRPEQRPQSIGEWRNRLLAGSSVSSPQPSQSRPAQAEATNSIARPVKSSQSRSQSQVGAQSQVQLRSQSGPVAQAAGSRARLAWVLLLLALIVGGGASLWVLPGPRCSLFGSSCQETTTSAGDVEKLRACLEQRRVNQPCEARSCLAAFPSITPSAPEWAQVGQLLGNAEKTCLDEDEAAARRARECAAGKDQTLAYCEIARACIAPYLVAHPNGRARSELQTREQKAARDCEQAKSNQQSEDRLFETALGCAAASDGCKVAVCFEPYLKAYPGGRHAARAQSQIAEARCAAPAPAARILNGTYLARSQQGCEAGAQSVRVTLSDGRVAWQHDARGRTYAWEGTLSANGDVTAVARGDAAVQANGRWSEADRWIEMTYPQCGKVTMTIYQMLNR